MRQRHDADLDILVVDDGSEDATSAVLADLGRKHAEIRIIRRENGGVTAARNTGLANLLPETDFITFLDSDDVSPTGRFAADLPRFEADPRPGLHLRPHDARGPDRRRRARACGQRSHGPR